MGHSAVAIPDPSRSRAGKYLTFQLGQHYYAMPAHCVRAVVAETHVSGDAITIGGRAVRVADIRSKLRISARSPAAAPPWIVVLTVLGRNIGFEVDSIGDVIDVRDRDIRNGTIQLRLNGRPYGRSKTLLEPDVLFTPAELDRLLAMRPL